MNWQEKVEQWMTDTRHNVSSISKRIGVSPQGLTKVLNNPESWETVRRAISLAKLMETSVEYLFDENKSWPPPPRKADQDQILAAIEQMVRFARTGMTGPKSLSE